MNSKSTSNYEAAIAAGKTYLSEYQPLERCDLLALYAAAQEYQGERYFWRTPDETTSMVGLGWLATFSQPKLADFSEVRSLKASPLSTRGTFAGAVGWWFCF